MLAGHRRARPTPGEWSASRTDSPGAEAIRTAPVYRGIGRVIDYASVSCYRTALGNTSLMRATRILLIAFLISGISSTAHALDGGIALSMKLVAPHVGWATTGVGYRANSEPTSLLWTTDGGIHWRDITPNPYPGGDPRESTITQVEPEHISDVYFIDTRRGWVLFCCGNLGPAKSPQEDWVEYDLAMTSDSGASWSVAKVKLPADKHIMDADMNGGQVQFLDSLHGWLNLTECAGHSCAGELFATSDGGQTWRQTSDDYVSTGAFLIQTLKVGWQVDPPSWFEQNQQRLLVTRDGANSWQQVTMPNPRLFRGNATVDEYDDLPIFENGKHGFVRVTYATYGLSIKPMAAMVLFETTDGGLSWRLDRVLTNVKSDSPENIPSTVVGSTWIVAIGWGETPTVVTIGSGVRRVAAAAAVAPRYNHFGNLDFATPAEGWALMQDGSLESTTDGGATWSTIQLPSVAESATRPARGTATSPEANWIYVDAMQLLSSDTGWVLVNNQLYRTESLGSEWENISIPGPHSGYVSVCFLNSKVGWALLYDSMMISDNVYMETFRNTLRLGTTRDGGATWSMTGVNIPGLFRNLLKASFRSPSPKGQISFADPWHGWMTLSSGDGTDTYRAFMTTSNGGKSWDPAMKDPGIEGSIRLVTPTEGYIRSITGDVLLATHDGARSWQRVSLVPPNQLQQAKQPTYGLPTFVDEMHGFLTVTYTGGLQVKSAAVLFATDDGGRAWKPDRVLANLNAQPVGVSISSAVADNTWITADVPEASYPSLTRIEQGATFEVTHRENPGYFGAEELSFVSSSRGWVLLEGGRLVSTVDGGKTWNGLISDQSGQGTATGSRGGGMTTLGSSISRIQLLAPGVGWAEMLSQLYQTRDGGGSWKELSTPLGIDPGSSIVSFFFPDENTGWIMYRKNTFNIAGYQLAHTTNAGVLWDVSDATVPEAAQTVKQFATAELSFADALDGWMNIDIGSSSVTDVRRSLGLSVTGALNEGPSTVNRGWQMGGMLTTTSDGGQTWASAQIPTPAGYFRLVTAKESWWLSAGGDAVFVTRDGAHSWKQITLSPPEGVYPANVLTYDLPIFKDGKHGVLPVTFSGAEGVKSAAVLFATEDGGETWNADRILANLYRMPVGNFVPSTVVGSTWITANVADYTHPIITALEPGQRIDASSDSSWGYYGTFQLSFVSSKVGWVLLTDSGDTLLSTTDGGVTWRLLDPRRRSTTF